VISVSLTLQEIDALLLTLDKVTVAGLESQRVFVRIADKLETAKTAPIPVETAPRPRLVEAPALENPATATPE
jgi:hypothetical protein